MTRSRQGQLFGELAPGLDFRLAQQQEAGDQLSNTLSLEGQLLRSNAPALDLVRRTERRQLRFSSSRRAELGLGREHTSLSSRPELRSARERKPRASSSWSRPR